MKKFAEAFREMLCSKSFVYYILVCITLAIMQTAFMWFSETPLHLRVYALGAVCESLLLGLPALLRGRWRIISVMLVWVLALFYFANLLYWRYWSDFIPVSLIFSPASYNGLVFNSVGAVFRPLDLVLPLLALAITVVYVLWHKRFTPLRGRVVIWLVVIAVSAFFVGQIGYAVSHYRYYRVSAMDISFGKSVSLQFSPSEWRTTNLQGKGIVPYVIFETNKSLRNRKINLSESDRSRLARELEPNFAPMTTVLSGNRDKNLIFIVVESLNSRYIGHKVDGRSLTPVLDSVLLSDGTISALNMIPQIKDGGSSDGQMIYNTGLLPIRHNAAAVHYGNNTYQSLARRLGAQTSREYIFENCTVWNHNNTTVAYGYDRLNSDMEARGRSFDRTLLEDAADSLLLLPQPFFAEITTLTMHMPYNDPGVTPRQWIEGTGESELQTSYFQSLYEFDTELGKFLNRLADSGLLEHTVVVLASDHDQFTSVTEQEQESTAAQPIAFIALNTGLTRHISHTVGQIDVFPTVLAIMGVESAGWNGLGYNMLEGMPASVVDRFGNLRGHATEDVEARQRRAWQLSDTLVRSDFFRDFRGN